MYNRNRNPTRFPPSICFYSQICVETFPPALKQQSSQPFWWLCQTLQAADRKCSYDRFTKVNTKSHNSSFHPYNLLSSRPGSCPHRLSQLHNLHLQESLELGINTIHHIPTPLASFPSHLT